MKKQTKVLLVIGIIVLLIFFISQEKKEAGEIVSWSAPSTVPPGSTFDITIIPSDSTNLKTWIADINIPQDWTVWDYTFSGGGGVDRQSFCGQEGDILGCLAVVSGTSIIDDTLIVTFNAPNEGSTTFTGTFTTVDKNADKTDGTLSSLLITIGSVECTSDTNCDYLDDACNYGICNLATNECYTDPKAAGTTCPGGTCDGSGVCVPEVCIPETCSSLGYNCGSWGDGCGGILNCGTCGSGYTCSSGTCIPIYIPPPECTSASDCNDDNICTLDRCLGGSCSNTASNEGGACLIGATLGICKSGVCVVDVDEDEETCEERLNCEFYERCNEEENKCKTATWVYAVIGFLIFIFVMQMMKS